MSVHSLPHHHLSSISAHQDVLEVPTTTPRSVVLRFVLGDHCAVLELHTSLRCASLWTLAGQDSGNLFLDLLGLCDVSGYFSVWNTLCRTEDADIVSHTCLDISSLPVSGHWPSSRHDPAESTLKRSAAYFCRCYPLPRPRVDHCDIHVHYLHYETLDQ